MTITANYEWAFYGSDHFHASAVQHLDGSITLTMTAGVDEEDDKTIGDSWHWNNDESTFLQCWKPVGPYAAPVESETPVEAEPLCTVWLNVLRWSDGTTGFDFEGPYASYEAARDAYFNDPFELETGEPCQLLKIVEVPYYG